MAVFSRNHQSINAEAIKDKNSRNKNGTLKIEY